MSRVVFVRLVGFMIIVAQLAVTPLAAQDATTYAERGPYTVGAMEFLMNADSERPVPVTVWYPALSPDGLPEEIMYDTGLRAMLPDMPDGMVFFPGSAIANAAPDAGNGPYPLVIYSHSNITSRFFTAYLQEQLASYGFVVMAAEHIGSAFVDGIVNPPETIEPYALAVAYRVQDVAGELDLAAQLAAPGEAFEGMIDMENVAIAGWSLGGNTALLLAGARFDVAAMTEWCQEPGRDEPCRLLDYTAQIAGILGFDPDAEGLWPSFADSRIDAVIDMAPGWSMAFGVDGYAAVTVPSMTLMGTADDPFETVINAYREVSSTDKALVAFEGAGHTIYGNCPQFWIDGQFPFCFDAAWDMAAARTYVKHFATAFLLAELKGDEAARVALAPDAVSFPGITYEAVGF